ncbi:transcriptional regulator [Sulfolobus acidocaldarius]|uniref:Conserved protein n=4 Tax=Sulfolobus acidocaldarius TaxID=2285 RepID=Q4JBA6_SULAC|nr:transcriptional regulator [Sulfolobus acidocaldarius]AAY79923.1 conserved protein [Sulfolobus acidocaldarius DSM 639]AGE70491.1 hypothetical protein SacN8_02565 [Sulfolobus acidocaldarius N8]AGE72764.1 hypothetical protein SacRon12I_02555 [Sulfolobus acidocaldarius Ron12/I]ALU29138.1 hypothetical protein ATY89_03735 [Sulfolobus acidocaldarius]ALU31864.1 hypothetical protein ATZ20_06760 [Sulfolobus acidocaldarius]
MELDKLVDLIKSNKALNVSVRLGILLGLYYVKSAWFKDLIESTRLNKAELYQHLKAMHKSGYLKISYMPTPSGKRMRVVITEEGEKVAREILKLLGKSQ